jgi:hypothetical protein
VLVEPITTPDALPVPASSGEPPASPRVFHAAEPLPAADGRSYGWVFPTCGVMVMVLTVVLWLGLRDTGGAGEQVHRPVAKVEAPAPPALPSPGAEQPAPTIQPRPEPAKEPDPPIVSAKPQGVAPPPSVVKPEDVPQKPTETPTPSFITSPVSVDPTPEPPKTTRPAFKPRQELSDEDLRKQLLEAPEVSLDLRSAQALLSFSRLSAQQGRGTEGAAFLLRQRPDFHTLPMRMGADCHLGKEPAENLQVLSRKLRTYVEASIPREAADVRPNADRLRSQMLSASASDAVSSALAGRRVATLASGGEKEWLVPEAIPALQQLLMAEAKPVRLLLVELLAQIPGKEATAALAQRALFDLAQEVRAAAVEALKERPIEDVRPTLVKALRYPWAPVADHAAEALVKLDDKDAVPQLVQLLKEPDPKLPAIQQRAGKEPGIGPDLRQAPAGMKDVSPPKDTHMVREVVRINHLGNCLLCHAPSLDQKDDVRGRVPIPGQPLPSSASTPAYYEGNTGTFVRADITYLKQDFSVNQPVQNPGLWPNQQRYDYVIRTRMPTLAEMNELTRHKLLVRNGAEPTYPQREAVLHALRYLTGKDAGPTSADWECVAKLAE